MTIQGYREATARKWRKVMNATIKKNVPHDMVSEYLGKGWLIHSTHRNYVTLAWTKVENPP